MSKRARPGDEDDRPPKRPRQEYQPPTVEEIHYARQLQQFLTFRQDGIQQLRNGIASFKNFLETILYHREEDSRARQISILREYFETQKPADPKSTEQPFLSQLWQAWSFANQNNNDHLASSVSAVLALVVKTMSGILDLRDYGVLLCRTVLQHQHLRLIRRCVDAPKHKEFIISPSIRLLTEVAAFDGGVVVNELYKRREHTFDTHTVRRNLSLIKPDMSEDEARRKPSIRTLTLRYVLALFKHLQPGAKIDILKNRPVCNALFQFLRDDPPELVTELLNVVEQSILKDSEVARSSKAALLNAQLLERVNEIATRSDVEHAVSERAFHWLKAVCTTSSYGALKSGGWYTPGSTKLETWHKHDAIDLGLDSLESYDVADAPSIRNTALLTWVLQLKAHSDERERDLALSCFQSAPELVAAYFAAKKLQLDPKLTNTWTGYASFLFEVIRLPVPFNFGEEDAELALPPHTTIAIESILPRPLTQQILSRCLNQNNELITFFALRILIIACEKLATVLRKLQSKSGEASSLWKEARERLRERFSQRCPPMKDVIAAFRKMPDGHDHAMQREAAARLLHLYYEVVPLDALEEQFDISAPLMAALTRSQLANDSASEELRPLHQLELQHLLAVAKRSTGMKWFHKQGGLSYSPIVTLLRMYRNDLENQQMRMLLVHVVTEHGILNAREKAPSPLPFDALLVSLVQLPDEDPAWSFLDDCLARASRQPVKYVDDLYSLGSLHGSNDLPSTLAAVVLEQASFIATKKSSEAKRTSAWITSFVHALQLTPDAGQIMNGVIHRLGKLIKLKEQPTDKSLRGLFEKVKLQNQESHGPQLQPPESAKDATPLSFDVPPAEKDSHPEITRWSQKDVELAIEDGDIAALILCLSSIHGDIRKQGLTQLNKLKFQLRSTSTVENSAQISLLIGELTETFELSYLPADTALPHIASTFAARALQVQTQPSHAIYPKLNKFLIRGPEWRVGKMPSYWLSTAMLSLPEEDDGFWREVQWVLDWLVDGLRTRVDLDILRKGGIFERLLAFWMSPGAASHKLVRQSIAEILYRATCIESGSNTLVTRAGVLGWLDMTVNEKDSVSLPLKERITDTLDMERFQSWTGIQRKEETI